jgi:hypothetical protein
MNSDSDEIVRAIINVAAVLIVLGIIAVVIAAIAYEAG